MGVGTVDVTAELAFNPHPAEVLAPRLVSVHIIVSCLDRHSIMLSRLRKDNQAPFFLNPS